MDPKFGDILYGLMKNRHLSTRSVCMASGRSETTIHQLLVGTVQAKPEILEDIAPVLQMPPADLRVIADVQGSSDPDRPRPYPAIREIGTLVALASFLTPDEVNRLVKIARSFRSEMPAGASDHPPGAMDVQ